MCDRWLNDFAAFLSDMGPCPDGWTIERGNNNGNYEPGNCRWIPMEEQALNRRNNVRILFQGESLLLTHWARRFGVTPGVYGYYRKVRGWSDEQITAYLWLRATQQQQQPQGGGSQ